MIKKIILSICTVSMLLGSVPIAVALNPFSSGTVSFADTKNTTRQISILTYNIHGGVPLNGSSPDLSGLASVMRNAGADIVLLQEVDSATDRSKKTYQAQKLASLSGYKYYYFANAFAYDCGGFGVAILSKYPIGNITKILLPKLPSSGYVEQRVLCKAQIKFPDNTEYTIATSHFDLTDANRQAGVTVIVNELNKSVYPVIFGGDFNVTPDDSLISRLDSAGFINSCTNGCASFPANMPNKEIDYIMYNQPRNYKVVEHTVIRGTIASDHCPVLVRLQKI